MSYRLGPFNLVNGNPFVIDTQVNADLHLGIYLKNESQMLLTIEDYGDVSDDLVPGEHIFIPANGKSAKMSVSPAFPGFPQTGISNILYAYLFIKGENMPQPGYSKVVNRATSRSNPKLIYIAGKATAGNQINLQLVPPNGKTSYLQGILATGGIATSPSACKITVSNTALDIEFYPVENTTTALYFREEFSQAQQSDSSDGTVSVSFNAGTGPHTLLIWGYNQ